MPRFHLYYVLTYAEEGEEEGREVAENRMSLPDDSSLFGDELRDLVVELTEWAMNGSWRGNTD